MQRQGNVLLNDGQDVKPLKYQEFNLNQLETSTRLKKKWGPQIHKTKADTQTFSKYFLVLVENDMTNYIIVFR